MALAFKRATTAAEEAFNGGGYAKQFQDYYGYTTETPVIFDWASAKAIEGESKFNSNDEVLPKSITVAKCISGSPNYLSGMVSNIAYKAGDDYKELAFEMQRKHWNTITLHFDDKSPKKGECTWTCEVKDGSLHATMHYSFHQYCGRQNYEDVCEWALNYLDDHENFFFEITKRKIIADGEGSCSSYANSDGIGYLKGAAPGKDWKIVFNWDEMAATPGRTIYYSNQPPKRNSWILANCLEDGPRVMYIVHWALDHVLKDDMGKEAFTETFDEVHVNLKEAPAHKATVSKVGKAVVFNFEVKMSDHQNASRSYDYTALGKQIENML